MTDGACNPALITVARGAMTESGHRGAIAICDADGALAETVGDVDRPVFPRSAIKALQAIPLVATGAADAAGYSHCDIALACASHSGAAEHARTADGILGRVGLTDAALACGAHWPLGETENRDLARHNDEPRRVHNNCSGKHAGMLALAHHLNAPTAGYVHADHPVQRAILDVLARYSGEPLQDRHPATDGCGAPNWPITLTGLARAFAHFAFGTGPGAADCDVTQRIMAACWAHPDLVAGAGRLDTDVMRTAPRRAFIKVGAEGVYCGACPSAGFALALKIDDGAGRAAEAAVMELCTSMVPELAPLQAERSLLRNWAGDVVGRVFPTPILAEIGAKLKRNG